jgi:molecular chaperone DnaK
VLYSTEKALKDYGDKVSQDERLSIERAVSELKDALKTDDVKKIGDAKEALLKASHKLAETMYKDSQTKAGRGPAENGGGDGKTGKDGKENVVEAEVVDEESKKA